MSKALQIKTTSEVRAFDDISLDTLQTAVGGWVQAIELADNLTMWLNEEGKLQGLPHNRTAQVLWDEKFGAGTDYLVGDVIFTGGADEDGMTLPLDQETMDMLIKTNYETTTKVEPSPLRD